MDPTKQKKRHGKSAKPFHQRVNLNLRIIDASQYLYENLASWRRQILKTLGLISCTKKKKDYPCKASEMYSASDLFRKAYAYCTKKYGKVAILSAKYGLLLPNEEIEPYNVTLKDMSVDQVKKWSDKVFQQFLVKISWNDLGTIYFHAGKRYRDYLIPLLKKMNLECQVPLENLSIGKQLQWYEVGRTSRWSVL